MAPTAAVQNLPGNSYPNLSFCNLIFATIGNNTAAIQKVSLREGYATVHITLPFALCPLIYS